LSKFDDENLNDILEDIYSKLKFLKDELADHTEHLAELTQQGNEIIEFLTRDVELDDNFKVIDDKKINLNIYIEDLLTTLTTNKDLIELKKLLDKYADELTLNQYGES
jgi:hypothetical protein